MLDCRDLVEMAELALPGSEALVLQGVLRGMYIHGDMVPRLRCAPPNALVDTCARKQR